MDFLYKNTRQGNSSPFGSEDTNTADSIPDQIELTGDAANLNGKFQHALGKRIKGEISDEALARDILDILKDGAETKKNRLNKR